MFLDNQPEKNKKSYAEMLYAVATLSRLSSENNEPYLGYRVVENIFCKIFNARNVSREDCSVDAIKAGIGIGIKTFLNLNGRTFQKIAEFNKDAEKFREKKPEEIVKIISDLRNKRIQATKRIYELKDVIYHCVVREVGKIKVFECHMDEIDIDNIKNIKINKQNTISFEDGINQYNINLSKSTLYKRYNTENVILDINVEIIEDPYELIRQVIIDNKKVIKFENKKENKQNIYLPLYSYRKNNVKYVPEKSGLNQWNAGGRARNKNEIYIPIPAWIHLKFNSFFPPRDKSFVLILPNGKKLSAKICQDGGKALMSNPNAELGKWLLRDVMNLKDNELLTYEKLSELGIDSVVIYKEEEGVYSINFAQIDSYEEFCSINR